MENMEAYISVPISRERESRIVQTALERIGIRVNNPCDIDDAHGPKERIPERVARECVGMMDRSNIGILVLDYFGQDCVWEVGYMSARGKPVYGVHVEGSSESLRDLGQYRHSLERIFDSVEDMIAFLKRS